MDVILEYYCEKYTQFMADPICNNFITRFIYKKEFNELKKLHDTIMRLE